MRGAAAELHRDPGRSMGEALQAADVGDLPGDHGTLRAAAKHRAAKVRVHAEAVRGGRVPLGDDARVP